MAHIGKKVIAFLLTLSLVCIPIPAYAEEPVTDTGVVSADSSNAVGDENGQNMSASDAENSDDPAEETDKDSEESEGSEQETGEISEEEDTADTAEADVTVSTEEDGTDSGTGTEGEKQPDESGNTTESTPETEDETAAQAAEETQESTYTLRYNGHIQNIGWQKEKSEGQIGTTGQSLRMEAFTIHVMEQTADGKEKKLSGAIQYRAHVQNIGWQNWVSDGGTAGTTGQKKQIEAVQIRLTGSLQEKYDIYYWAHCADYGNLGWAKNGETAETTGLGKSLQALTIVLVKKGSANAPAQSARSYYEPTDKGCVTYQSHVQDIGWQDSAADGAKSGTTGQSKRMEALRIYLANPKDANGKEIAGSIEYRAHVQDIGWQNWVSEGKTAGTTGQSKRLEAVQIRLTGELAKQYDVYYRVHSANIGDLGWAKNGETAGSIEYRKAVESVYIKVVKKGSQDAPTQSGRTYLDAANIGKLSNTVSVSGKGWQSAVGNKQTAGTTGQSRQIEALKLSIDTSAANAYSGGIQYKAHIQDTGWSGMASNGNVVGNSGSGKRIEAVQISLTGELAKYCDVYYRAHVQDYGWLGWAMNGQSAGTTDCSYRMEALQVTIVPKWSEAPGSTSGAFKNTRAKVRYENAINTILNSAGRDLSACYWWVVNNLSYQTLPIPMSPPAGYSREEGYAIYGVENRRGNCYCYAAAFAGAARALGYDATYVEGQVTAARGGYTPHGWVVIRMNGGSYICDPEAQREIGRYTFYMQPISNTVLSYIQ